MPPIDVILSCDNCGVRINDDENPISWYDITLKVTKYPEGSLDMISAVLCETCYHTNEAIAWLEKKKVDDNES